MDANTLYEVFNASFNPGESSSVPSRPPGWIAHSLLRQNF